MEKNEKPVNGEKAVVGEVVDGSEAFEEIGDLPSLHVELSKRDGTEMTCTSTSAMDITSFLNENADFGSAVTLYVTYTGDIAVQEALEDLVDDEIEELGDVGDMG